MFPTLLQIGPITISTFGVAIALGFFIGSFLIWQKGREEHFEEAFLMDGILLVSLIALIGARAFYVIFNWSKFSPGSVLDFVGKPGFSRQGALLVGLIALAYYCQKRRWDFYKLADVSVFGLTIGITLGKVGLFFSPVSLIEAFFLILLYRLLLVFDKNYRTYEWYKDKRGEAKPGFLFFSFLGLSSLINLGGDIFRNQLIPVFQLGQLVDVLFFLAAVVLLYLRSGKGQGLTILRPSFKKKKEKEDNFRVKAGLEAK